MADIVQLEEKGTVLYPKTHVKSIEGLVDFIYPVGAIYMSANDIDINNFIGGTWERIKGKVLVGVDEDDADFSMGKTGGEKTQAVRALIGAINDSNARLGYYKDAPVPNAPKYNMGAVITGDAGVGGVNYSTVVVRKSDAKDPSTVQPYTTVYMWKRVS